MLLKFGFLLCTCHPLQRKKSQPIEGSKMTFSATTDPELRDWIRWASDSGEVPIFVRTIADAASIADLRNYALLRPVLLELKRKRTPVVAV